MQIPFDHLSVDEHKVMKDVFKRSKLLKAMPNHKKGKKYKKKLCCGKLTDISDAYEFSLVVNPKSNKE